MIVVDTGIFIDLLRGRKNNSLELIIVSGLVLLSQTVYLELQQGVQKKEQRFLNRFLDSLGLRLLWPREETCLKILKISRGSGIKVGLPDLLILSDAFEHNAQLMTFDKQLKQLALKANITIFEGDY